MRHRLACSRQVDLKGQSSSAIHRTWSDPAWPNGLSHPRLTNRIGTEGHLLFTGPSTIVNPKGEVILQTSPAGREVGLVEVDLELARDREITARNHVLADRRSDEYGFLLGERREVASPGPIGLDPRRCPRTSEVPILIGWGPHLVRARFWKVLADPSQNGKLFTMVL